MYNDNQKSGNARSSKDSKKDGGSNGGASNSSSKRMTSSSYGDRNRDSRDKDRDNR